MAQGPSVMAELVLKVGGSKLRPGALLTYSVTGDVVSRPTIWAWSLWDFVPRFVRDTKRTC